MERGTGAVLRLRCENGTLDSLVRQLLLEAPVQKNRRLGWLLATGPELLQGLWRGLHSEAGIREACHSLDGQLSDFRNLALPIREMEADTLKDCLPLLITGCELLRRHFY